MSTYSKSENFIKVSLGTPRQIMYAKPEVTWVALVEKVLGLGKNEYRRTHNQSRIQELVRMTT